MAPVLAAPGTRSGHPFWREQLAGRGVEDAVRADPALAQGANVWRGELVCQGVAESLELPYRPLAELLGAA